MATKATYFCAGAVAMGLCPALLAPAAMTVASVWLIADAMEEIDKRAKGAVPFAVLRTVGDMSHAGVNRARMAIAGFKWRGPRISWG